LTPEEKLQVIETFSGHRSLATSLTALNMLALLGNVVTLSLLAYAVVARAS